MTRKDYPMIAEALRRAQPHSDGAHVSEMRVLQHSHDCEMLANALANDNPAFDRERFLKACGVAS